MCLFVVMLGRDAAFCRHEGKSFGSGNPCLGVGNCVVFVWVSLFRWSQGVCLVRGGSGILHRCVASFYPCRRHRLDVWKLVSVISGQMYESVSALHKVVEMAIACWQQGVRVRLSETRKGDLASMEC